jgi:hypothetical protein
VRAIIVVFLMLALAGCATGPVVDFDERQDFSTYRTFAFISNKPLMLDEGAVGASPLLEGRVVRVTRDLLTAQGYTFAEERGQADFVVGFTVGARDKLRVDSYPDMYRANYGRWGWGGSYYMREQVDVDQYTEGTLALDIYDVSDRKPVWHGVATRRITKRMRENSEETLREVIAEILSGFPPQK